MTHFNLVDVSEHLLTAAHDTCLWGSRDGVDPALPLSSEETAWANYHRRQRDINAKRTYKFQASRMQKNELLVLAGERTVRRLYKGDICPGL